VILILRRTHRAAFVVLAAGLPLLFVAGLSVRTQPAAAQQLPASLVREQQSFAGEWDHADALLYWTPATAVMGDALPPGARLLGTVGHGMRSSPADTSGVVPPDGFFVVYSLATQQVVDSFPVTEGGAR